MCNWNVNFATGIFTAKIRVVSISKCATRILPQKFELLALQNLQLEFFPQKSELCAFQNLQLEFLGVCKTGNRTGTPPNTS